MTLTASTAKPANLEPKLKRLAKRKDGIYYAISIFLALTALTIALFGLLR